MDDTIITRGDNISIWIWRFSFVLAGLATLLFFIKPFYQTQYAAYIILNISAVLGTIVLLYRALCRYDRKLKYFLISFVMYMIIPIVVGSWLGIISYYYSTL